MYNPVSTYVIVAQWPGQVRILTVRAEGSDEALGRALLRLHRAGMHPDSIAALNEEETADAGTDLAALAN